MGLRQLGLREWPPAPVLVYGPFHILWTVLNYVLRDEIGAIMGAVLPTALLAGVLWYGLWRKSHALWLAAAVLNFVPLVLGVGNLLFAAKDVGLSHVIGSAFVFLLLFAGSTRRWIRGEGATTR